MIARHQGWELADVAQTAGADLLATSSLKAALDLDWDEPRARDEALRLVLSALLSVERWRAVKTRGYRTDADAIRSPGASLNPSTKP